MKVWTGFINLLLSLIVRIIDLWEANKADKLIDKARENHEEIDRNPVDYMDSHGMLKPGNSGGFKRIPADVSSNEADRPTDDGAER